MPWAIGGDGVVEQTAGPTASLDVGPVVAVVRPPAPAAHRHGGGRRSAQVVARCSSAIGGRAPRRRGPIGSARSPRVRCDVVIRTSGGRRAHRSGRVRTSDALGPPRRTISCQIPHLVAATGPEGGWSVGADQLGSVVAAGEGGPAGVAVCNRSAASIVLDDHRRVGGDRRRPSGRGSARGRFRDLRCRVRRRGRTIWRTAQMAASSSSRTSGHLVALALVERGQQAVQRSGWTETGRTTRSLRAAAMRVSSAATARSPTRSAGGRSSTGRTAMIVRMPAPVVTGLRATSTSSSVPSACAPEDRCRGPSGGWRGPARSRGGGSSARSAAVRATASRRCGRSAAPRCSRRDPRSGRWRAGTGRARRVARCHRGELEHHRGEVLTEWVRCRVRHGDHLRGRAVR
jgi:hypothetical protein